LARKSRARSTLPVKPFVGGVVQFDLLFGDVSLVAPAREVDPERLVPDGRLACSLTRDFFVPIRESAHVDAETVGLIIPGIPNRSAVYSIIDSLLGTRRNDTHDAHGPQDRNGAVLSCLDDWNGLRNDLIFEPLAFFRDHDKLGHEHARLTGPVDDLVIEVMDGAPPLARQLDRPDAQWPEREVQDPDPLFVAWQKRCTHHLIIERRPIATHFDGSQCRHQLDFLDLFGRVELFSFRFTLLSVFLSLDLL